MPGRFDDVLEINHDGCLTPAGPLELAVGETVKRLDVWVWQISSACIAVQRVFEERNKWEITTDHHENHVGPNFQPGTATAMGLMISTTAAGQWKTFQWTEGISLVNRKV